MLDFTRLDKVRRQRPLIHCVSNIVTANDCANLALAVGASPMMAQAPEEMEAISAVSDATVLNTGTPDAEKFRACRICAVSARHPVVLDPVGVGASPWRLGQVRALLDLFTPSILRVNLGEARALLGSDGQEQGVDSPLPASREARRDTAMDLARRRGTAVLLSGPEDSHHRWGAGLVRHRRQRPDVSRHRHGLYAVGAVRCVRRRGAGRRRGGCPGLRLLEDSAPAGRSTWPQTGAAAVSARRCWTPPIR